MSLLPRQSLVDMDSFFDNFFAPTSFGQESGTNFFAPRVDLKEKGNHYEISLELAGVKKEDIHVSIEGGVLTIEAECKRDDTQEKDGRVIRQERRYGKFMRSFNLGSDVKHSDISGHFENGVLTLTAPKKQQQVEDKQEVEIH